MAYTLAFAITGSLLLALTVIPVLMTMFYRRHFESAGPGNIEWHNPAYAWIEQQYKLRKAGKRTVE